MNITFSLLPSRRQILAWLMMGAGLALFKLCLLALDQNSPLFTPLAWILLSAFFAVCVIDAVASTKMPAVTITRRISHSLAVNQWATVVIEIHHTQMSPGSVQVFDGIPATFLCDQQPVTTRLWPGHNSQVSYRIKPLQRGAIILSRCWIRQSSPWHWWLKNTSQAVMDEINVYPDYSIIAAYNLLASDQHTAHLGIKKRLRRGEGRDFHQLREYRTGDSLRNVDWKASSRHQRLIAREYQDERDQRMIILLDAGQRMRAKDQALSHFDHALNAILLVSYVALRQGDSVAIQTFGQAPRWLPPQKGQDKINNILNGLFDLQASLEPGDYVAAATQLCGLQQKRSLVILVTNTRDEDTAELQLAIKQLQRHHLVLLADLREAQLDQQLHKTIRTLDDALLYASMSQFEQAHQQLHQQLKANGIFALQAQPHNLAAKIATHYLAIKRAGVL